VARERAFGDADVAFGLRHEIEGLLCARGVEGLSVGDVVAPAALVVGPLWSSASARRFAGLKSMTFYVLPARLPLDL
jgi:hypothetical protein